MRKIFFILFVFLSVSLSPCFAQDSSTAALGARRQTKMEAVSLARLHRLALDANQALHEAAACAKRPVQLYLHWSAGHYGELFAAYHINIDADGTIYVSDKDLAKRRAHTYMRNGGSIGISLACAFGATPESLGAEPPTAAQIETMAQVIAVLSAALDIPIDEKHVMTHGEAGDNADGYFPPYESNNRPYGMYGPLHTSERWDLAILNDDDVWMSGGAALRLKAIIARFRLQKSRALVID